MEAIFISDVCLSRQGSHFDFRWFTYHGKDDKEAIFISVVFTYHDKEAAFISVVYLPWQESHLYLSCFSYHGKEATLITVVLPIMARKPFLFQLFCLSWQ